MQRSERRADRDVFIRGFAASQCGEACLAGSIEKIPAAMPPRRSYSLQDHLIGTHGQASLTALHCGKPQKSPWDG